MMMGSRHPVVTGKLASGADECAENMTRWHVLHLYTYALTHL